MKQRKYLLDRVGAAIGRPISTSDNTRFRWIVIF